jgi:hypothetical protein
VGAEKRAHSRRWMNLYAPATPCVVPALDDACARALADVAHAWARPRCVQGVAMT